MRGTSKVRASGFHIKNQDVFNINPTDSSRKASIHLYESIQSAEIMATRFYEDLPKASIQTRTEIQEKSKAKVGTAEMDESCQDCADGIDSLCVVQIQELEPWADGIAIVVAVYGVLFLDWNSQGSPDNQPFHGVCC